MRDVDALKISAACNHEVEDFFATFDYQGGINENGSPSPYIKVELQGTHFRSSFPAGASRPARESCSELCIADIVKNLGWR